MVREARGGKERERRGREREKAQRSESARDGARRTLTEAKRLRREDGSRAGETQKPRRAEGPGGGAARPRSDRAASKAGEFCQLLFAGCGGGTLWGMG